MATVPGQYVYQPNWFERHWKLLVGILATLVLLFVLVLCTFVLGIFAIFGRSESVAIAVAQAQKSPVLIEKVGQPIERDFWITGNINTQNGSGEAKLSIPVSGPKGKATLHVREEKQNGVWTIQQLTATIDSDNNEINLLPSKDTPGSY